MDFDKISLQYEIAVDLLNQHEFQIELKDSTFFHTNKSMDVLSNILLRHIEIDWETAQEY